MQFTVVSILPTYPPLDPNMDLDERVYPDGTMWEITAQGVDTTGTIVFQTANKTDYTLGTAYTFTLA